MNRPSKAGNVRLPVLVLCIVLLSGKQSVTAQDNGFGSRFDYLNISPSAQQLATGGLQAAIPSGTASIYSNPALLPLPSTSVLDISYSFWIQGFRHQYAALNLRRNKRSLAFGLYSSRSDNTNGVYTPGSSAGEAVRYMSLAAAYAYKFGPVTAGLTAQILLEEIQESRSVGVAMTAGAATELFEETLRLGISVANIGTVRDSNRSTVDLPAQLRVGLDAVLARLTTGYSDDLSILISTRVNWTHTVSSPQSYDFTGLMSDSSWADLGLTVNIDDFILLNSGYRTGKSVRNWSYGIGFLSDPVTVHYAVVPFASGFGTAHSIGLQYAF